MDNSSWSHGYHVGREDGEKEGTITGILITFGVIGILIATIGRKMYLKKKLRRELSE